MENVEMTKEWFVTHEGKQFGPVSIDDLKFEAEQGKLNPRLDMVWRKDMDDWIPAGDLKGLFDIDEAAQAEEIKKASPQVMGVAPEVSEKEKLRLQGKWGGSSRATYLCVSFLLPLLLIGAISVAGILLKGKVDENIIALAGGGVMLIFAIFALVVTINRFTNLAMTRWWFLSLFVPILSLWTYYRLLACPAGYAEHKKLDGFGWLLSIIYWLFVLIAIALFAATIYAFSQAQPDPESLKTTGDFLEILKKTYAPE